jgi:hypothetical protein
MATSGASNRFGLALSEVINGKREPLVGLSEVRFYYCPALLCWLPGN